jgi:hypothetical protein
MFKQQQTKQLVNSRSPLMTCCMTFSSKQHELPETVPFWRMFHLHGWDPALLRYQQQLSIIDLLHDLAHLVYLCMKPPTEY